VPSPGRVVQGRQPRLSPVWRRLPSERASSPPIKLFKSDEIDARILCGWLAAAQEALGARCSDDRAADAHVRGGDAKGPAFASAPWGLVSFGRKIPAFAVSSLTHASPRPVRGWAPVRRRRPLALRTGFPKRHTRRVADGALEHVRGTAARAAVLVGGLAASGARNSRPDALVSSHRESRCPG
jgi:hypothetical protein